MSAHFFCLHVGHLTDRADQIARRHGARHVNYTEPFGQKRGWFCCLNRGSPHNSATADAVMADIERVGGIDALRVQR